MATIAATETITIIVIPTDEYAAAYTLDVPADQFGPYARDVINADLLDVVGLTDGLDMWIDDEGYGIADVNVQASRLAGRFGFTLQDYYGVVVLAGVNGETGPTISAPARWVNLLTVALPALHGN